LIRVNGPAIHFRPEIEILLCCARTRVDDVRAKRIRDLVETPIDWQYLLLTSFAHGVMPLLYKNLRAICPEAIPEKMADELRYRFKEHAERNLLLTAELLRLLGLLSACGIPGLPYKGPVLAASVYRDVSLRTFSDLDILIDKRNIRRAKDLILSQGYRPRTPLTEGQEAVRMRSKNAKDLAFVDSNDFVKIELHWGIAGVALFPLDTKQLWSRLEKFELGGTSVLHLGPEDMLLMLCVHGAKHFFKRLEWVCDVAELLNAHPNLRWDEVIAHAQRLRTNRMLFFGLTLAADLLGAELPKEIRSACRADLAAQSLSTRAQITMFRKIDSTAEMLSRHAHRMVLRERRVDRMRLRFYYFLDYIQAVFKANEEDRKRFALPKFLAFLYVFLRPLRLMSMYGVKLFVRRGEGGAGDSRV